MKRAIIPLACLSLGACALVQAKPLTPAALEVPLAQTDAGIDGIYNATAKAYLRAAPTMRPALKARVKPLLQKALKAVQAADAAEILGQADTVQAQINAAVALLKQAKSLAGI